MFDHHESEQPERPPFVKGENWVHLRRRGAVDLACSTSCASGESRSPGCTATIFALGIHEDTGSLTYPRTTIRDAEMLALAMRLGASQALIERYLHSALVKDQREVLMHMVDAVRVERVRGLDIHVVALDVPAYVDGLSVVAHKLMELINAEVLIQAVAHGGQGLRHRPLACGRGRRGQAARERRRGRSRAGGVGRRPRADSRGGHPYRSRLRGRPRNLGVLAAAEIMSRPVRFIDADTPVTDALVTAQRYGHSGICVRDDGRVVGIVARRDLDKAMRHGLGHAPVKGVMTRNVSFARASTGVDELRRMMVEGNIGRVPVVKDEAYEAALREKTARVEDVLGIVTRTDVLAAYQGRWEQEQNEAAPPQVFAIQALADHPFFGQLFKACSALSDDFAGVYLVGGFVRDLLIEQPNTDIDIAVEGDGIEFGARLAAQLGGRIRAHRKFKTAVVLLPPAILGEAPAWLRDTGEPFHVDVATTRTEFYDYPAALPRVEHASIRQDLFRRDFTINAMAISLRGRDFGTVIDFFGGLRDLRQGVIRVLHNLSFIEDPTRIFRAVRYENRYGFHMDEQTKNFARSCVEMHLVGDLSSVRLRDELISLLSEEDVRWTLGRLFELGVAREVHPKLATGAKTASLVARLDALVEELGLRDEVVTWRLRLTAMTRNMAHDELYLWLEQLKIKQSDSAVIREAVVVAPLLPTMLLHDGMSDWEVVRALRNYPAEALVFALGEMDEGAAYQRVWRYVTDLRYRTIDVTGDDLLAMGMKKGPAVGRLLERLREMRVKETIKGRDQELAAARILVEKSA